MRCRDGLILGILVLSLIPTGRTAAHAQAPTGQWTAPTLLGKQGVSPTIVADSTGRVHVMWTANVSGQEITGWGDSLLYSSNDGDEWSTPNDVLAAPSGMMADSPDLMIGGDGNLHVIWRQGTNVVHSLAPLLEARQPQKWITSAPIVSAPIGARPCNAVSDTDGLFHLVCSVSTSGAWGVAYLRSVDSGQRWTEPIAVNQAVSDHATDLTRVAVDAQGNIHVTWTETQLPDGWPLVGVYYSRSTDAGQTWSESIQLAADAQGYSAITATQQGHIHVVWNSSTFGRHHRWSADGGATWSSDILISEAAGTTQGAPAIGVDSAGTVHVIMFDAPAGPNRADDIRYASWDGTRWTPLRLLSEGETGVYVAYPALLVSEGNQLHGLWCNLDLSKHPTPNLEQNAAGIWHTRMETAAPHVRPEPRVALQPTTDGAVGISTARPETATGQAPPQTPISAQSAPATDEASSAPASDSTLATIVGPLSAALMVLIVVIVQLGRRKRR